MTVKSIMEMTLKWVYAMLSKGVVFLRAVRPRTLSPAAFSPHAFSLHLFSAHFRALSFQSVLISAKTLITPSALAKYTDH